MISAPGQDGHVSDHGVVEPQQGDPREHRPGADGEDIQAVVPDTEDAGEQDGDEESSGEFEERSASEEADPLRGRDDVLVGPAG